MLPCEWLLLKRSSLWILNIIIEVSYYDWIKNGINLISQNLTTWQLLFRQKAPLFLSDEFANTNSWPGARFIGLFSW